jgi:hypothetical protein
MAREIKRTVYLVSFGDGYYFDGDGNTVKGWSEAKIFGLECMAQKFIEETPKLQNLSPRIEPREFSESDLLSFERSYEMHMRWETKEPPKP